MTGHEYVDDRINTLQQRFDARVNKTDSCWLWTGHLERNGYPTLGSTWAHRLSYELHVGHIPAGYQIDHLCRVPACVNPKHLEAVTPRENFLRGTHTSAIAAKRSTCIYGHPYTAENLVVYSGGRVCKTCRNIRNSKRPTKRPRKVAS